jgi:hypothetical protein
MNEKTGKLATIKIARAGRESCQSRRWQSGQIL